MKKQGSRGLAVLLASAMVMSLAACGGKAEATKDTGSGTTEAAVNTEKAGGAEEASESSEEAAEIVFSWWGGDSRHEVTEQAIEAFMAK